MESLGDGPEPPYVELIVLIVLALLRTGHHPGVAAVAADGGGGLRLPGQLLQSLLPGGVVLAPLYWKTPAGGLDARFGEHLFHVVRAVLRDPVLLRNMRERVRFYRRPRAAARIVELVLAGQGVARERAS